MKGTDKVFDYQKFRGMLENIYGASFMSLFSKEAGIPYQTLHGLVNGKTQRGPRGATLKMILSTLSAHGIRIQPGELYTTEEDMDTKKNKSESQIGTSDIVILELAKRLHESEENNRQLSARIEELMAEILKLKIELTKATCLK